jgi:flagellar hook-associated protein FlgK
MIVAQQAYSAASQVVSTVKTMFDTLSTAVR